MIEFHTIDFDEVMIHYAEAHGPEPGLVILHGLTGSHPEFLPWLKTPTFMRLTCGGMAYQAEYQMRIKFLIMEVMWLFRKMYRRLK